MKKPYTVKFNPEIHREIKMLAAAMGTSIGDAIKYLLEENTTRKEENKDGKAVHRHGKMERPVV